MIELKTPYYIVYEDKLRKNLELIKGISEAADVSIIMAFKANALWKTFPIISEYIKSSTASSLNEMKLSLEFLGNDVHTYCPVYTDETFKEFLNGSSHITFNSLSQFDKFYPEVKKYNLANKAKVSCGIRINPRVSIVDTDIYNPCMPGSRFGITAENLPEELPDGLEGFHFHVLCESDSHDLEQVWFSVKTKFSKWLKKLKWLNMGGGHLMTKSGYDPTHLIGLLKQIHQEFPNLKIIMEPGSAFTWQTGDLVTTVLDIVEDSGIKTAIIDASFACHMPDCLEMPYQPQIEGAEIVNGQKNESNTYRLGGNSCLSGDFVGFWKFNKPLVPGQELILKDMNHYTTVKTNMFNGIKHPSIWIKTLQGDLRLLREFTYEDYKKRMD